MEYALGLVPGLLISKGLAYIITIPQFFEYQFEYEFEFELSISLQLLIKTIMTQSGISLN